MKLQDILYSLAAAFAMSQAPGFAQNAAASDYCSTENLLKKEAEIVFSDNWKARQDAAISLMIEQGPLDDAPPDGFDHQSVTAPPIGILPIKAMILSTNDQDARISCKVLYDIEPDGSASNPIAACSRIGFDQSVIDAVLLTRFAPVFQNGEAVKTFGAVTTINYCLPPQ